jgi:hypothetical protein
MEGKIGEIYLWQNKDKGKQEQFKKEDAPAPSLHNFNLLRMTLFPLVIQMSNRKIQIEKFAFEKFRRFSWRRLGNRLTLLRSLSRRGKAALDRRGRCENLDQ